MNNIYNCTGHELKIPNIVDSQGIYLFDESGKRYMDLESGVWCTSIGHKNPRINDTIKKQIDCIMHAGFCYSNHILQEAAKLVLSITNFEGGKCVFLCSGSEAIEISRQIAKHLTGKKRSMTLHDSYLGSYSSVINRTEGWHIFNWNTCQTCQKHEYCDPSCEALQAIPADISDFIFEPGSSSGFVRFPPKLLIQNIVTIIHRNHGKVITNDVTTGIGRTGKWFGYQHYDIEPDMVAMGKGIGNGYPVSVAAINRKTMQELDIKPFKYAQSHQNDPLGAAVAREVIQTIQDNDLISQAAEKGAKFLAQLQSLVDGKTILAVRGRGLMFGVDIVNEDVGNAIFNALLEQGYIVCNRKALFRIDPPLSITEPEFEAFIEAFRAILAR
ncbi:aminotransferase class-III [Candidatus Vecturithrix granuli]|uniref:Aminotransferase class-III n=1 Tax=Vecturithrix granuli TaxID=1499967 RepID=A0A081C1S9_VECG1|nr:aminotransferase class-III [Candidatus Vecturithrix granuli]